MGTPCRAAGRLGGLAPLVPADEYRRRLMASYRSRGLALVRDHESGRRGKGCVMSPNRRIFLNIVATYGRSLYALVCGLVISRWVLAALGKGEFGNRVCPWKTKEGAWR